MQYPIEIYTDGSSRGNPGPGGWGVLIIIKKEKNESKNWKESVKIIELGGKNAHTTNNAMELTATLRALEELKERSIKGNAAIHSDSAYVLAGIEAWVYAWEKNGWKTKEGADVANQELWKKLLAITYKAKLMREREIKWQKVKGHAGNVANERVDEIATKSALGEHVLLFTGSLIDYEKILGYDLQIDAKDIPAQEKLVPVMSKKKSKSTKPAYSYVSVVSGKIHADKTWEECKARVIGKKGTKYKKVFSKTEEGTLVGEYKNL